MDPIKHNTSLEFEWTWDSKGELYLFGTSSSGGGVFQDDAKDLKDLTKPWTGNAVHGSEYQMLSYYATMTEAMDACAAAWKKLVLDS